MAYLPSNGIFCFNNFEVFWTDIGKDYLIGKNTNKRGLYITSFSLGDNDCNYLINPIPKSSFITDITGNHKTCLLGTKVNSIRYEIVVEGNDNSGPVIINHNNKPVPDCP